MKPLHLPILAFSLAVLLCLGLSSIGPAMWPDSAGYLSVARSLAGGNGIMRFDGREQVEQPPLYPAVLAGMSLVSGRDPLWCAVALNATLYLVFVWLTGRFILYLFQFANPFLIVFVTTIVSLAYPLISAMLYLGSEALFMVALLGFLLGACRYAEESLRSQWLLMAVTAAVAGLTRYAGVTLAVSGAIIILLLSRNGNVRRRITVAIAFGVFALLPLFGFVLRNQIVHGTFTGRRGESVFSLADNLRSAMDTSFSWILPMGLAGSRPMFILLGMFIGIAVLFPLFEKVKRGSGQSWTVLANILSRRFMPLYLFAVVYTVFIVVTATVTNMDRLGGRLLLPLFIPFVVIVIGATRSLVSVISGALPVRVGAPVAVFLVAIIALPHFAASHEVIETFMDGKMTFLSQRWQGSETIAALKAKWRGQGVYSNEPEALYIVTGIEVKPVPSKVLYNSSRPKTPIGELRGAWPAEGKAFVVWFHRYLKSRGFYTPEELAEITYTMSSVKYQDGQLLEVERKP